MYCSMIFVEIPILIYSSKLPSPETQLWFYFGFSKKSPLFHFIRFLFTFCNSFSTFEKSYHILLMKIVWKRLTNPLKRICPYRQCFVIAIDSFFHSIHLTKYHTTAFGKFLVSYFQNLIKNHFFMDKINNKFLICPKISYFYAKEHIVIFTAIHILFFK